MVTLGQHEVLKKYLNFPATPYNFMAAGSSPLFLRTLYWKQKEYMNTTVTTLFQKRNDTCALNLYFLDEK